MTDEGGAGDSDDEDRDRVATWEFLLRLRRQGHTDHRLISALEAVPRRLFVPHGARESAYVERPLPIECGQTISAPELVAAMTAALAVGPQHQVLEIGTGSGYQAAVLARLARHVYTIDRFRTLVELARLRFGTLKIDNITTLVGDGTLGWPANASFDRIIVTAAAEEVPLALFAQLRADGVLVAPVGPIEETQTLVRYERIGGRLTEKRLGSVRFVPLIPGVAERL